MWGVIPAAGTGSRIQPLAFSKELLPVGHRVTAGVERPRAVSEYLLERMLAGGATRVCFIIAPGKWDIPAYFGARFGAAALAYVVQPQPEGLCDALFRALPLVRPDEPVLFGLPDTIWFPVAGLAPLPDDRFTFLLFPVSRPELFDAVCCDEDGCVREIQVKQAAPTTSWIWGAGKLPGRVLHELHALWRARGERDLYFGTLVDAYLADGGRVWAVSAGQAYVDVGTLHGYREAMSLLAAADVNEAPGAAFAEAQAAPTAAGKLELAAHATGRSTPA